MLDSYQVTPILEEHINLHKNSMSTWEAKSAKSEKRIDATWRCMDAS